jgi:hypothetical protein
MGFPPIWTGRQLSSGYCQVESPVLRLSESPFRLRLFGDGFRFDRPHCRALQRRNCGEWLCSVQHLLAISPTNAAILVSSSATHAAPLKAIPHSVYASLPFIIQSASALVRTVSISDTESEGRSARHLAAPRRSWASWGTCAACSRSWRSRTVRAKSASAHARDSNVRQGHPRGVRLPSR